MKNIIILFLFIFSGLFFTNDQNLLLEKIECDYWYEIVLIGDTYWMYEYCGDKLITSWPLDEED